MRLISNLKIIRDKYSNRAKMIVKYVRGYCGETIKSTATTVTTNLKKTMKNTISKILNTSAPGLLPNTHVLALNKAKKLWCLLIAVTFNIRTQSFACGITV